MRQNFNYHTHTSRCGHASPDDDEQYVIKAINAGFKTLGFSDHAPFPDRSKKSDRMDYDEFDDYIASVNYLKEKYQDQIRIILGVEMEYLECYDSYIKNDLANKVDYIILGQHYYEKDAKHDYCYNHNTKELIEEYARLVVKGVREYKFLYLAHPDYFCGGIDSFDETCQKAAHEICQACVETDTPIELNIQFNNRKRKVYDGKQQWVYPLRAFWEIAAQYPLKVLYGFDAHDPKLFDMAEQCFEICDEVIEGLPLNIIKDELI